MQRMLSVTICFHYTVIKIKPDSSMFFLFLFPFHLGSPVWMLPSRLLDLVRHLALVFLPLISTFTQSLNVFLGLFSCSKANCTIMVWSLTFTQLGTFPSYSTSVIFFQPHYSALALLATSYARHHLFVL